MRYGDQTRHPHTLIVLFAYGRLPVEMLASSASHLHTKGGKPIQRCAFNHTAS